eukprot:587498-Rhodomonas_salina.2
MEAGIRGGRDKRTAEEKKTEGRREGRREGKECKGGSRAAAALLSLLRLPLSQALSLPSLPSLSPCGFHSPRTALLLLSSSSPPPLLPLVFPHLWLISATAQLCVGPFKADHRVEMSHIARAASEDTSEPEVRRLCTTSPFLRLPNPRDSPRSCTCVCVCVCGSLSLALSVCRCRSLSHTQTPHGHPKRFTSLGTKRHCAPRASACSHAAGARLGGRGRGSELGEGSDVGWYSLVGQQYKLVEARTCVGPSARGP